MISLQVKIHAPRRTSKSSLYMLRLSGGKSRISVTRSQQGIFSISRNVCCVTSACLWTRRERFRVQHLVEAQQTSTSGRRIAEL